MENPEKLLSVESETFNEERLSVIAGQYGLHGLRFITSPEQGVITENAILEDGEGARYFAKFYRDNKVNKYKSTYRASEIVASNPDIPVSLPLIPTDGSYTIQLDDRLLALFPYVEHHAGPPESEEEDLRVTASIAENLGRIHSASISEDEDGVRQIQRWQPESLESRKEELAKLVEHISQIDEPNDFDRLALQSATLKIDMLAKLPHRELAEMRSQICHADYHGNNVLYNDEMEVVAIIDWDNAGLAEPYVDLLQTFMTNVINKKYDTYATERKENAITFMESYKKGTGATIDVDRLQDAYHILMHDRIGVPWPMTDHYFSNERNNDARLQPVLDRSIAFAEHYEGILEFILDVVNEVNVKEGSA